HLVHDLTDPRLGLRVVDRHHGLDPPVEVALHQVRRPDVPLLFAAVGEPVDPRVLEELADDAADADAVRLAGDAGLERTDAADDHLDVDAGLARAIQGLDRRRVDDRVDLDHDAAAAAGLGVPDLPVDQLDDPRAECVRRDEQPAEVPLA